MTRSSVTAVDASAEALARAAVNLELNPGLAARSRIELLEANAFDFLRVCAGSADRHHRKCDRDSKEHPSHDRLLIPLASWAYREWYVVAVNT